MAVSEHLEQCPETAHRKTDTIMLVVFIPKWISREEQGADMRDADHGHYQWGLQQHRFEIRQPGLQIWALPSVFSSVQWARSSFSLKVGALAEGGGHTT